MHFRDEVIASQKKTYLQFHSLYSITNEKMRSTKSGIFLACFPFKILNFLVYTSYATVSFIQQFIVFLFKL